MTPERLNNLFGHSVLLVESQEYLDEMSAHGSIIHRMKPIKKLERVPEHLLDFMDKNNLESAVIHTASLCDEQPILEAYKAGKKIVLLTRDPPATYDEVYMYQRLEDAGVARIRKRLRSHLASFEVLSKLFEDNT